MRNKYKRFVFLTVLLWLGIVVALVGCSYAASLAYDATMTNIQENQDNQPVENESRFSIVLKDSIDEAELYIFVDKETNVEYLLICPSTFANNRIKALTTGITPIYNADGSLKIYEGELKWKVMNLIVIF